MTRPNWKNRTIWTGDNLEIMRGMKSECVDLIYLDPPFNSKHNYAAPIGSRAAGAAFKDTWTLEDVDMAWWGQIAEVNTALYEVLDMARHAGGKSTMSYLIYMAVRILEMHRILKGTGSLYLHCDPTMSHYLKMVLDAVFGKKNFLNEIIWYYRGAGTPKQKYAKRHDVLFWYAKQVDCYHFNPDPARQPYADATVERFKHYIGNVRDGRNYGQQTLNKKGKHPDDVFTDIQPIAPSAKDRLGYPTQKPLELLKRIIETSSKEGNIVLDPFCGCATTCSAAEVLNRQWVGIDISPKAYDLVLARLKSEAGIEEWTKGAGVVIQRTDIPIRKGNRSKNIKQQLFGIQQGKCNLCHHAMEYQHFEVDHVIPKAKGGMDDDENLQLLCGHCNRVKGKGTMEEARVRLTEMGIIIESGRRRR